MKKRFFIMLTLVLALILAGCGPEAKETQSPDAPPEKSAEASQDPVILRIGDLADANCWNP